MAVPTWVAGEVLASADVNNWFVPLVAYKTADTARASTTTLAADPDITITPAASAVYYVEAVLIFTGASGAGFFAFDFILPTSATFPHSVVFTGGAGGVQVIADTTGGGHYANTEGTSTLDGLRIAGLLTMSTTSSAFALSWAQHASNATATTLKAGSVMTLRRVG